MSTNSTPNFFVVLDLVIKAFHLDHEEPDLRGSGPFQHQLSGRRFDIKDKTFRTLLGRFGSALRRSGIFPGLPELLRCDRPSARVPLVVQYLGEAQTIPPSGGDLDRDLVNRLVWLAEQHEAFLGKARGQVAIDEIDPAFGMQPLMRFTWHHLTMAIAMLRWSGLWKEDDLIPDAPHMTWWMEQPASTPMSLALSAFGPGPNELILRLVGSDAGLDRNWDEKTIANLRHGGPSHPTYQTMAAVVGILAPEDPEALSRWRRWYGLRELARRFASVWGWEWLNGNLATSLAHAEFNAMCLKTSSLVAHQAKVVASVGIWAGWRLGFARWAFGEGATALGNEIHPVIRLDYLAISNHAEIARLQHCINVASGGTPMERDLREKGRDAAGARSEALHVVWMLQGDQSEYRHLHPLAELLHARCAYDWSAMERAARKLVDQRPELPDNHRVLIEALASQKKFDEALTVARLALMQFPFEVGLRLIEVEVLMSRGDLHTSAQDFEAARDKLLAMNLADSDWAGHLHLADCYLALGDWAAARNECYLVAMHNDQCGEARAIAGICSEKLGQRQPANKAAEHAARRGEKGLVDLLHHRNALGELGTDSSPPVPRWHRIYVFRA
jgi:hypothetical protein